MCPLFQFHSIFRVILQSLCNWNIKLPAVKQRLHIQWYSKNKMRIFWNTICSSFLFWECICCRQTDAPRIIFLSLPSLAPDSQDIHIQPVGKGCSHLNFGLFLSRVTGAKMSLLLVFYLPLQQPPKLFEVDIFSLATFWWLIILTSLIIVCHPLLSPTKATNNSYYTDI